MNNRLRIGGLVSASALALATAVTAQESESYPFTLISEVEEANTRVVALAIDFGQDLLLNWSLDNAFAVTAALDPVASYSGDLIGNSAAAEAPRQITGAYTRATPDRGTPQAGRYVIVELDPADFNASSWYVGFNPGVRQLIPYGDNMRYEVDLLRDLNLVATSSDPTLPGPAVETVSADAEFTQAGERIATADEFEQGVFELPANETTKEISYNLYVPDELPENAKVPLVVFLHGSGQSHDYRNFPDDIAADTLSPLLTNQGGVTWIENAPEPAIVLVPQAPARDTKDAEGESGWRSSDTQALLLGLVEEVLADHPEIDTDRLYLTGLSMGALGSWKILANPDPAVSEKFAAAVLLSGAPLGSLPPPQEGEAEDQRRRRMADALQEADLSNVTVPVWIGHADTDPVVDSLGGRVAFTELTEQGRIGLDFDIVPSDDVIAEETEHLRHYVGQNENSGAEVHYVEHLFGDGSDFLEMGMVTPNGHFSWEIDFKNQEMIDWLFAQEKSN